jgi:adenylate cyclase
VTTYDADELAAVAGSSRERIDRMVDLHVLEPTDGRFLRRDIARVRIAEAMDRAGIDLDLIHDLVSEGQYSMAWIDAVFPDPVPVSDLRFADASAELGIEPEFLERFFTMALQVPTPGPQDRIREDDLEVIRVFQILRTIVPTEPDRLIASTRFFGENLRRIAESQVALFAERLVQPQLDAGVPMRDVLNTLVPVAASMIEMGDRVLDRIYHRHLEHAATENVVANMETVMDEVGVRRRSVGSEPAIAFLDLSGSTSITVEYGDSAALTLAEGLVELAGRAEARGGKTVKFLGDGVMLHFADPARCVPTALELVGAAPDLGLPAARVGASVGPVLFRDGDYFGRTVILAARLADRAGPDDVLVSSGVAEATSGVTFEDVGAVDLKGLSEPLHAMRASRDRSRG